MAGVAIALQRVITAFAAHLIMLRWRAFTLADRISMAVVRSDVTALGSMHAMIMEMGEPPAAVAALASGHQAEHVRRASRNATYPPTFLSKAGTSLSATDNTVPDVAAAACFEREFNAPRAFNMGFSRLRVRRTV